MSDYLQRYLPEYDDADARARLSGFEAHDLREMLIRAYKEKRVLLKMLEEQEEKIKTALAALNRPSALSGMPDIPNAADLRKMSE